MRIACSTSRAQSRPRNSQVPSPMRGIAKPFTSMVVCALMIGSLVLRIVEEAEEEQRPPAGLRINARRAHRARHRALEIVPVKGAGLLARYDPGALHIPQLVLLAVIELVAQATEGLVEDVVPNLLLAIDAGVLVGGRARLVVLQAWRGDDTDAAFRFGRTSAGRSSRLDAVLDRLRGVGSRMLDLRRNSGGRRRQDHNGGGGRPHYGVSQTGAWGGFTTRMLVALSFLSSAISASLSLKSNTSRFCSRWSGVAVRGIEMTPICTR